MLDSVVPGLCVDCTVQGHKSFMLRARYPGGRNAVRRLLGEVGAMSVEQARTQARQWLGLLAQGLDPKAALAERKRRVAGEQALNFAAVCASYFQHFARAASCALTQGNREGIVTSMGRASDCQYQPRRRYPPY